MADYGMNHGARDTSPTPQKVGDMGGRKYDPDHHEGSAGPVKFNDPGPQEGEALKHIDMARSRPDVRINLEQQAEVISHLQGALAELGNRLDPILMPTNPNGEKMLGEDSLEQSALAHSIDSHTDQVRFATRMVVDLLQRVQL